MDVLSWYHGQSNNFYCKTVSHSNSGQHKMINRVLHYSLPWGQILTKSKNKLNFSDYVIFISEGEDKDVKNINESGQ